MVKKVFVKHEKIVEISKGGMVHYYCMYDNNYPPKLYKTECWYSKWIKALIENLLKNGYTQIR